MSRQCLDVFLSELGGTKDGGDRPGIGHIPKGCDRAEVCPCAKPFSVRFFAAGFLQEGSINLLKIAGEKTRCDRGILWIDVIFVEQIPAFPDCSANAEISRQLHYLLVLFNIHRPQNCRLNLADIAQCPGDMIIPENACSTGRGKDIVGLFELRQVFAGLAD
jgi:hypothetical protein